MMARLKELEDENRRLKKTYAEERWKADILKEAIKKVVKPSRRREMEQKAVLEKRISIRLAFWMFSVSESYYRYQATLSDDNNKIADWLNKLTYNQRNWGFGLCFLH